MTGSQNFDRFIRDAIGPVLKDRGYSKRGYSFLLTRGENWGVIQFQKSVRSTAQTILFTVDVGVALGRLRRFDGRSLESAPSIDECHWSMRLESLLSGRDDRWWSISTVGDVERVGSEFQKSLGMATDEIEGNLDDVVLRDMWLRGESPGLSDVHRLRNLSILLKELGPAEQLEPIVDELRELSSGKPTEAMVARHIRRLGLVS